MNTLTILPSERIPVMKQPCVYELWRNGQVYYIGSTRQLYGRLHCHKHAGRLDGRTTVKVTQHETIEEARRDERKRIYQGPVNLLNKIGRKYADVPTPTVVNIALDAAAREARAKALEAVAARHDGPVKPNRALVDLQALTLGYRVMAGEAVAS